MIGALIGIIKLVAVVCLLLLELASAFILMVLVATIVASILQYYVDLVFRRKK